MRGCMRGQGLYMRALPCPWLRKRKRMIRWKSTHLPSKRHSSC
nr:MAG TPA: hypothetical protein [Caudoviricetes sp.]